MQIQETDDSLPVFMAYKLARKLVHGLQVGVRNTCTYTRLHALYILWVAFSDCGADS